jgi:chromosome segregation ATPase
MANEPQKQGSFTLFGQKSKDTNKVEEDIRLISSGISNLSRRVRVLEDQQQNLRRKLDVTEQNIANINKKFRNEVKVLESEINEVKHAITDIDNKILILIKEIRMSAKKEDVDVLEKYINLWEPIQFITRKEAEKIIIEEIENKLYEILMRKKRGENHSKSTK